MLLLESLLVAASVCGMVAGLPLSEEDPLALAVKAIDSVNRYLGEKNASQLGTEGWSSNWGLMRASLEPGWVRNMSSLELRGDSQSVIKNTDGEKTTITYDLTVGLSDLLFFNRYSLRQLGSTSQGRSFVTVTGEAVRVTGSVNMTSSGECAAGMDSVELLNSGEVSIKLRSDHDADVMPVVIGNAVEIYLNKKNPSYKKSIMEGALLSLKKYFNASDFSNAVCRTLN